MLTGEALYVSSTSRAPDAASTMRHPVRGVAAGRQRGRDLVERHAEALRDRGRGQRVRDEVAPGHGARNAPRRPTGREA